jgi:hypothetical protein
MTVPWSDTSIATTNSKPPVARRHRGFGATLLTLAALAVVVSAFILYNRPAHLYGINAHGVTWTKDVNLALSERPALGPLTPSGPLRDIPGVGRIVSVVIEGPASGKKVIVLFLKSRGWNATGLAYIEGFSPPPDTCNAHIGGPWWQLGSLNTTSMGCARGFHFTGGG